MTKRLSGLRRWKAVRYPFGRGVKFSHVTLNACFAEDRWDARSQNLRLARTQTDRVEFLTVGISVNAKESLQLGFLFNLTNKLTPHFLDSIGRRIDIRSRELEVLVLNPLLELCHRFFFGNYR